VFAEYDLLDLNGTKVAEGHKASFCLEDTQCDGSSRRYRCGRSKQGISKNCGDLYSRGLDCQWVDITGVPEGTYTLQLNVNPTQLVHESNVYNNIIQCTLSLTKRSYEVKKCSQSGKHIIYLIALRYLFHETTNTILRMNVCIFRNSGRIYI